MKCKCPILPQSKACLKQMVQVINPFTGKSVNLDPCIKEEILDLWSKGIRTVNSCCGHKRSDTNKIIVVHEDYLEKYKKEFPKDYKRYNKILKLNRL